MYPDRDYVENKVFWLALRLGISEHVAGAIFRAAEEQGFHKAVRKSMRRLTLEDLKDINEGVKY